MKIFECCYYCETENIEPEKEINTFAFPGGKLGCWMQGVSVHIYPNDETKAQWIGSFASGQISKNGVTGSFSHPDPNILCILSKGRGYMVDVRAPGDGFALSFEPIMGVIPNEKYQLLVFYDFTRFVAYGKNGVVWETEPLSWDGIDISEINENYIKGMAWDAPQNKKVEFSLFVKNGAIASGITPRPNNT